MSSAARIDTENLIDNEELSEASITQTLHERFKAKRIYTKASDSLLAVNPFEELPIYDKKLIDQHSAPRKQAHIFGVARAALAQLVSGSSTAESIVFGGESGSGKSFNAKQVFRYLASQSNSKISADEANSVTTVLKSFGCASTLKSESATRFGSVLDLLYNKSQLCGLNVKYTLPIEASRVVAQKPGERNFNVFYEVYHGLNNDAKNAFGIRDLQKFFYMNQGKTSENVQEEEDRFDDLDNALSTVGFSEDHRLHIYKIIAIILHIGNIFFRTKRNPAEGTEHIEIGNQSEIKWISYLLEVDYRKLETALLKKRGKEDDDDLILITAIPAALDNRDALAMIMYEELFKWILSRISTHFKCTKHTGTISIVDYYGFERYNNNGLEEFFVNSVNERLENTFVKHAFHDQLVEYLKDGIMVDYKVPPSIENGKVVELLFKKPYGLLPLLTDECKFPRGSDETYIDNCNLNHLDKTSYGKARNKDRLELSVRHYAGTTWYNVQDFVRKNRIVLSSLLQNTLSESRNGVISMLFRSLNVREGAEYTISLAYSISTGCQSLVEKINSTNARFVRCIRPNNERQPQKFDIPIINRQIKTLLIAELLRFRAIGYPVKILKQVFAQSYRCLLPGDIAMCQNEKEIIQDILQGQGVKYGSDYKIGNEYVFLRERLAERYETLQCNTCSNAAFIIQKTIKGYVARKNFGRKKAAIVKLQAGLRGWKARKEYAAQREKIFVDLGRMTKRSKRLQAYHEAFEGTNESTPKPTTLVGCLDIDDNARKVLERSSPEARQATCVVTQYLTSPMKNFLHNFRTMSLRQYADQNFKGHSLEPRREPIMTPFLHKESDVDFCLSVEIFKLVLKLMNDHKLNAKQRDDLGRYIVLQGITNPCQRDEILVQAVNQINGNPDKIAVKRGWCLISMALSAYPPTENVIPMLTSFFNQQQPLLRDQLFSTLQKRLKIYDSQISRELPSSNLELLVSSSAHNTVVNVGSFDGLEYDVHVSPWATAEEVAERVLRQRGIGAPLGWTIEVDTPSRIFAPAGSHFLHDVFAEVDGVEGDEKRQLFFNFPPEKLVKPKVQRNWFKESNGGSAEKVMSPELRQKKPERGPANDKARMNTSTNSARNTIPPEFSPAAMQRQENQTLHRTPNATLDRTYDEDEPYIRSRRTNKSRDRSVDYDGPSDLPEKKTFERLPNREVYEDESHMMMASPQLQRKMYSRPNEDHHIVNFAPPPTFQYPQQMPMMQYVPVMMHPQQMMTSQGMMSAIIPQPVMMQPQQAYTYTPQYPQVPIYPAPLEPRDESIARSRRLSEKLEDTDYRAQSRSNGYDLMQMNGQNEQPESRAKSRGDVPSEYSTMSVASRIRRMPVPEHTKDVDRFLDAVFDQILTPDEHRIADVNPATLARSIKGGAYDPRAIHDDPYTTHQSRMQYHQYPQYAQPPQYNTIKIQRQDDHSRPMTASPLRNRSNSVPRHVALQNDGHITMRRATPTMASPFSKVEDVGMQDYSDDQSTSSEDRVDAYRGRSRDRSLPRQYPQSTNSYSYGYQQPVYMMMPVQMHDNPSMMPMMMPPRMSHDYPVHARNGNLSNGSPTRSRSLHPTGERTLSRRSPSVDAYMTTKPPMIRRTPDDVERLQLPPRPKTASSPVGPPRPAPRAFEHGRSPRTKYRSRERMEAPMMTRQMPPRVDYRLSVNGTKPYNNANNRSASPEPRGLARLPFEAYVEPAVKHTQINSEHPNPNKLNFDYYKTSAEDEKQIAKEALSKLNQQLKKLPPPVDNVRVVRPPSKPTPNVVFAEVAPEPPAPEPVHIHIPAPKSPPQPVIVPPKPVEQPRPQWVIETSVDRPPGLQERIAQKPQAVPPPAKASPKPQEKPAVKYVKAPWKLTIRKEMFYPGELLNDIQVIDQVFAQIIEDCRKSYPYRIRLYERQQIEAILRDSGVPPEALNHQANIHPDTKVKVIENARQWPIYFSQIHEVIEVCPNEFVNILFAISEHGIRLLLHTPHDIENPLKVQDHFPFENVVDVSLESSNILAVHTRQEDNKPSFTIRIKTNQATQIKKTLDKCLSGEVEKRRLVRALEKYSTNEPNHLSFNRGDIIELLPAPEGDDPPVGNWLYGRIGNQFGYLLPQYVDSNVSENVPPLRFESSDERDEHDKFFVDDAPLANGRYTMLEYATKRFRQSKDAKRKDDWTWNELAQSIKFSQRPITQSLHRDLSGEVNKRAVEVFSCIMRFMGDLPMKRSETFTDVVFNILLTCHKDPSLVDEIYCHIIKQTTSNVSPKKDSAIRGWRLFTIFTAYFRPSAVFQPYLQQYLAENCEDVQRQYHGTAKICFDNLQQTLRYNGRQYLLGAMEVQEASDGKTLRRQGFFLSKEHCVIINVRSVTVVEEVIQELCNTINVRSLSEQEEFTLCFYSGKEKKQHVCKKGDYIMDICTEMEHKKLPYQFHLRRTVWIHPLRFDNAAYIDAMFDQTIDDYMRGSYIATNSLGHVTAATTADIVKLAALLHLLSPDKNKPVKPKGLADIFPKSVLEPRQRAQEDYAHRVNAELQLCSPYLTDAQVKGAFLELLSEWPLFGVTHYRLRSAVEDGVSTPEVTLAIGKDGVQLLQPKSQEIYKQWAFSQIASVELIHKTAFKVVRIVTVSSAINRTLEFQSEKSDEIAHLIGQYLTIQERSDRSTEL